MSRMPRFALTLAASVVLIALDQQLLSAADLEFDQQIIDVVGDNRPGISVPGNSLSVAITDSSVTADGQSSHGVILSGANTSALVSGSSIVALGDASHGLSFAGSNNTGALGDTRISTRGDNSFALNLVRGAQVQADGLTLNTRGRFSSAINMLDDSAINVRNSTLQTSGNSAHGIYLMGSSDSQRALATVDATVIRTAGDNAIGVNVNRNATATLSETQIFTTGANAFGVWVPDDDSQLAANNLSIDTQGDGAIGVFTQLGGKASLNGGQVHTNGNLAYALYAGNESAIDGQNLSLQVGTNSVGAFASDRSQITLNNVDLSSTETSIGLAAYSGSTIDVSNSSVQLTGVGARALQANNGGTLRLNNVGVSANGTNSMGLQSLATAGVSNTFELQNSSISAANGRALSVQGGSASIDLSDSQISGQTLLAVEKRQMADGSLVDSQDVQITATRSQLVGGIRAEAHNAQLELRDHSSLKGDVHGLNNLTLDQSLWQMTDDSQIGRLHLNDGQVSFVGDSFSTLTIDGDLTGNGSFLMNTDLATLQGNLLKVGGQIEGEHTLVVEDSGNEPASANGQLMLVDGNGGAGRFGLYGEHVDAGAFRYTLEQKGNDWFLVNTAGVPIDPTDPITPAPEHLSKGANAAIASQTAAATLWSAQMNTLVKRLGELRLGKDEGGVWTRAIGSRYNLSEHSSRAFSQNNTGVEIGADKAIPLASGKVYVGGMVGTAKSDLNFGEGASGQINSKMVGAYATYLNDNGVYVDSVLKYSRFDNDLKLPTNLGNAVKGSYDTDGYGMSVEVGKHIALKDGWFVEPQIQLSATRTAGARYTASNGLRVDAQGMESLQSRVGSLFGRSLELANGMKAQPYVKASYITEHAGDSHVTVNGNKLDSELPGSRAELGFGGILQVSEKSKFSVDAEYAKGHDIEQPWGVTIGYRYLW
ncbi:MAG: autotransporter outer membrane beta-barrel domain-containing protein [Pseudomonas sp.]